MIIKKLFLFFVLLNLFACSQISFVYNDAKNLVNPIYNKTNYEFSGTDIASAYRYAARYFGNTSSPTFYVKIKIEEETTKRSVQSNQAISKMDYELTFIYYKKSRNKLFCSKQMLFLSFLMCRNHLVIILDQTNLCKNCMI